MTNIRKLVSYLLINCMFEWFIGLMGENGLDIIFGETVKKSVFEKTEKNIREANKQQVKQTYVRYCSLLFAVFAIFSYIF